MRPLRVSRHDHDILNFVILSEAKDLLFERKATVSRVTLQPRR